MIFEKCIWHVCPPAVKALASVRGFIIPVMPDITHPMLSVILNRWVTVEASRSLSCVKERRRMKWKERINFPHIDASASVVTDWFKEPRRCWIPTNTTSEQMRKRHCGISKNNLQGLFSCEQRAHCELTGTFFCVTTTAQSLPRTATDVSPPWFMALKAYSEKQFRSEGEITHLTSKD